MGFPERTGLAPPEGSPAPSTGPGMRNSIKVAASKLGVAGERYDSKYREELKARLALHPKLH